MGVIVPPSTNTQVVHIAGTESVLGVKYFRTNIYNRADDSASPSLSASINIKPNGDGTAGTFNWYHSDTVGYAIHITDSSTMTGDGLIGLGLSNGSNTGMVVGLHGGTGIGIALNSDAGVSATGLSGSHLGGGTLIKLIQGQSGTPGTLLVVQGWSGAPAAARAMSIQNTSGQEFGFWNASDLTFHIINAASAHETYWAMGSGPQYRNYVYTGTPGQFWATYFTHATNHLTIQSASGAAAKGSESMNTMIDISNGNTMGFFGSGGTTKPTVTGSKAANAALTSLMTALSGLGLVTDSTT